MDTFFKKNSLKNKLLVLMAVSCIVAIAAIGIVVYGYVSNSFSENKKKEMLASATLQANELHLLFEKEKIFTEMLGKNEKLVTFMSSPQKESQKKDLTEMFRHYVNENSDFLIIYAIDINGRGVISSDPRFIGEDFSFRTYFKKSIQGESFLDVVLGKITGQAGYFLSRPITDSKGMITGVLVLKIGDEKVNLVLTSGIQVSGSISMITDQFGVIIDTTKKERSFKSLGVLSQDNLREIRDSKKFLNTEISSLPYQPVYDLILKYEEPIALVLRDDLEKEDEFFTVAQVKGSPFFLVVESGLDDLHEDVIAIIWHIILIISIVLIILSFAMTYGLKLFLRPVEKFKSFFGSISNGYFNQELEINTEDEFHDMAESVNLMSRELAGLYGKLDSKVKEQTLKIEEKIKDSEDQNKAILNILEDVEKEKDKTETLAGDLQKFKLAVDSASDQVVITDAEGIVIYGNAAVKRITGYDPEEAIGKKAGTLWKTPMPKEYYEKMWDTIKNKKKVFVSEIQNRRKNGELCISSISISPVLGKDGNVVYFVGIEHDITKEKEMDRAKSEFVSIASHQLRTPLSAIGWYTEMLLNGDVGALKKEQKTYLEEVASGNKRMIQLVDSLLNMSRLDLGTFIAEPEPIQIQEIAKSIIDELKPQVLDRKLKIKEIYDKSIDTFNADRKLFRIIMQNLLSNAVKYAKEKTLITIEVFVALPKTKIGSMKISKESVVIKVSDFGIGIPENQKDKIFTKMFRADNARKSETEGTGLGLYIIKSIVEQSSGCVWFESKEDEGTTFYVSFPRAGMKRKEGTRNLD